jgi:hypothetical protein
MPSGIGEWIAAGELLMSIAKATWPRGWQNVEVRFSVREVKLGFRCEDNALGRFGVWVVDDALDDLAFVEGEDSDNAGIDVGYDKCKFGEELLTRMFQMARCKREHERTRDIGTAKRYFTHREAVIAGHRVWMDRQNPAQDATT